MYVFEATNYTKTRYQRL